MISHVAATRRRGGALIALTTAAAVLLMIGSTAGAAIVPTVPLQATTAAAYAVLGHSTVTNTGPSVINGNVGLWSGTSITGFPPGTVVPPGTIDATSAAAMNAQANVTAAYTNAHGRPVTATTSADLGNKNLGPGVYDTTDHGALQLTGPLVLNGGGNLNAVFIFQTNSSLTTAPSSTVSLINGAQECNVFWQIGSSATLGTNSVFVGNILALASVTVTTGVLVHGRAFARTGAVTLDTDVFTKPTCALAAPTTTAAGGGGTPTTAAVGGTTLPGGGTGATLPGGGTGTTAPALPGTPTGGPGVPGVTGPPRTGGGPLRTSSFPWMEVVIAGVLGTAALGGVVRTRRLHAHRIAAGVTPSRPSRR